VKTRLFLPIQLEKLQKAGFDLLLGEWHMPGGARRLGQ